MLFTVLVSKVNRPVTFTSFIGLKVTSVFSGPLATKSKFLSKLK